ncbi:MAG: 4-hydroxy-tetrahydrodipicolinate synthase [Nanoarchaeota archaeon]|nr:4-hydroxy-tetrahydrodipicolinate synthase [Nanoarchaeota archaeon]MBU1622452.1 4-hydroxy-tetrahydrodipicolinate synthase [Nanoarchaeota archaeon]
MIELPRKFTALVTPFHANGDVNYDGLRENVDFQVSQGWAPLVLGTTGEAPTIEPDEFASIVEAVIEETDKRKPVMVGTGSNSTKATVEKTKLAKDLGADLALVVMPYYNKPEPSGQLAHFLAAAEVGLPIVLYDVKSRTGREIDYKVIEQLAKHPNVAGYKAATHQLKDGTVLSERVAQELSAENFRVWSGDDGRTVKLIQNFGAYGVISVASNVCPKNLGKIVNFAIEKQVDRAEFFDNLYNPLFEALFREGNPIPVKGAMNLLHEAGQEGMNAGSYRLPMTPPQETTVIELRRVLTSLNMLKEI